jgi:septum formation protein
VDGFVGGRGNTTPVCIQVVESSGRILEKAEDHSHAVEMLSLLSNKEHEVHTGARMSQEKRCILLIASGPRLRTPHLNTDIKF